MAQLQVGSQCDSGIAVNGNAAYTMIQLPSGFNNTAGFDQPGDLFFDSGEKQIRFFNDANQLYQIEIVDFINA
jgi:hypothetical protein